MAANRASVARNRFSIAASFSRSRGARVMDTHLLESLACRVTPALLLEESTQRMVLPLGRRGRARTSLEGSFEHQVRRAEKEAGVRRQL